ncbi:MAG TPA: hypothetical protein VFB35_02815 [Gaiellaceae bacterium]|nr:hypothetical protein [Gaiellaceae bacterium]
MLSKLLLIAGLGLLLAASTSASAFGWRTALVASNQDTSDFAFFFGTNRTTLANVHALRARLSSTMTVKLEAEVECKRGESEASRKVVFSQTGGVRLRVLPVPVRGGVCTVDLDVNASDPGRYDVLLQFE